MAREAHCELARRIAALDEVVPAPGGRGPARVAEVWRAARRLRRMRPTAAVVLAPSFEAALTLWLARIPRRIGHPTDGRGRLLTDLVPFRPDAHRADSFAALADALAGAAGATADAGGAPAGPPPARTGRRPGIERRDRPRVDPAGPPLVLTAADRRYAGQALAAAGWADDTRPLFVNPAAAKTPRAWSAARFRALVETLAVHDPARRFLVHDRSPFAAPPGWLAAQGAAPAGGATLPQLCALLERCALYVGNDSGPAHLAAALGVPTVTVFGPSAPHRTGPRARAGAAAEQVTAGDACSPCRERFFQECPSPPAPDGRPPCLDAVAVAQVAEAVERTLAESALAASGS